MRGIVSFRNSETALRRWSITMTQRAMAITELRTFSGLENSEQSATQCRPSRIKKDHAQMTSLSDKVDHSCNPFSIDDTTSLLNIATGHAASQTTSDYLLNTLQRGSKEKENFVNEWTNASQRFLQPVKRKKIENFATENLKSKGKIPAIQKAIANAQSMRDAFIRLTIHIAEETGFDLREVLAFPIISYPLSIAHSDGSHVKTEKAALLRHLESLPSEPFTEKNLQEVSHLEKAKIYDGGLLLHSVISNTNAGASYESVARSILSVVCKGEATEVHVCLDKYIENSIKDSERKSRGAVNSNYVITGPEQKMRQNGKKVLENGVFKHEFGKFLLDEWGKSHYWNIFDGKVVYASLGGLCYKYVPDVQAHVINVSQPEHLQGDHEEADTLIAFHVTNIKATHITVRASDTDVLAILIGIVGQQEPVSRSQKSVVMDCGMGNDRRFINVSNIVEILEDTIAELSRAVSGFHAFTGCDVTSAFFRYEYSCALCNLVTCPTLYKPNHISISFSGRVK